MDRIDKANARGLRVDDRRVDALRRAAAKWEARADASARRESPAVARLGRIVARLVDRARS